VPLPSLSRFDGMNGGGGKIIAANGVAVVVVDFRDSVAVSSLPEVALFRAGLNAGPSAAGGHMGRPPSIGAGTRS
jgi:hypothetical protein